MPYDAPQYMRDAAEQGLKYYADGLAGDGLTPKTVREARAMARGEVSADKWVRVAAWIARHLPDLDAPDADPDSEGYPSAGVVAHLLWGSGPSKTDAVRAMEYAQGIVATIEKDDSRSVLVSNVKTRAAVGGVKSGDFVTWLDGDDAEFGQVVEASNLQAQVTKWDDEDGYWYATEESEVIDVAKLTVVDGVPGPLLSELEATRSVNKFETRVNVSDFELRETGDGMTFTGYASVFNSRSENLGGFTEFVAPGAFTRSLKSRNDVKLLWNHDAGQVLGSTRAKSMTLTEDARGLKVEAKLPNTQLGRDTAELLRTGLVDSMSFGFNVIKDSWNAEGNERTLHAVRLHEVSIVAFPAYAGTAGTTSVRSLEALVKRTAVDPDALDAAISKLEAGEDLDDHARDLLTSVIEKLSPSATFEAEVEPSVVGDLGLLALKKKKLDILGL